MWVPVQPPQEDTGATQVAVNKKIYQMTSGAVGCNPNYKQLVVRKIDQTCIGLVSKSKTTFGGLLLYFIHQITIIDNQFREDGSVEQYPTFVSPGFNAARNFIAVS